MSVVWAYLTEKHIDQSINQTILWKRINIFCLLYEPILQRSTLTNQSIKRLCEEEWTYYVCLMSLSYREAYWPINQSNDCVKKNKHIFLLYEPTSQCLFTSQTEPWLSPSTILPRPLTVVKTKIGYLPIKKKKNWIFATRF